VRKRIAALALGAGLLAACSATGTPVDPAPVKSVDRPLPVGVEENPPPTTGSAAPPPPQCNPRQSLRPNGLPPAGQMPAGSPMRVIQDRGRLIAGVDQNTFLFGFRNPSTNRLEGFDIDRVREIALAIFGGDPNAIDSKIQFKVISSAEREPALEKGEVDVVVRTFTATCGRWQRINFSATYYVAGQRLLVDKASPVTKLDELGGKKVCAQRGTTSIRTLSQHPAKPIPVATDTWSDCLVMLQQGQVEAVSTDDTILGGMASQDPNVKMAGPRFTQEPYGIGITAKRQKQDDVNSPDQFADMVRFVNAVLEKSIKDGQWQASYGRWLEDVGEGATPPTPEYR
jgi:polar amino acid transport system substrate-binding protein